MAKTDQLKPTELRVLLAIAEVGGAPEVADALGIGEATVKFHLKRLFAKTGARRQADLVKLVAGLVSPLAQGRGSDPRPNRGLSRSKLPGQNGTANVSFDRRISAGGPNGSAGPGAAAESREQRPEFMWHVPFQHLREHWRYGWCGPWGPRRVRKEQGELHEEDRIGIGFGGCRLEPRWLLCRQGQGAGSGRHQGLMILTD
ncbi:MAG: helix-turn-helix transcriptional regulator [Xanthobacteraceae bacterium]|nr:helix-turn-helix transcriptional regulator [Xanthobacteraceae bacterium]